MVIVKGERPSYKPDLYWIDLQGDINVRTNGVDSSYCALATTSKFDYSNTASGIGAGFKTLLDALHRVNYIKVPVRLLPTDLLNIDFKMPIYLRQYGAYFSLEKLQYVPDGVSKIELIKLNL